MRRLSVAIVSILLLGACTETPVRPDVEGDRAGTPPAPFAFLPPLGPPVVPTGPFNPRLAPVIEICQVIAGSCGPVISRMSLVLAPVIRVNVEQEKYETKWASPSAGVFRIRVLTANSDEPESTLFGEVDVTAAYAGHAVPIAFRIEEGALCDPSECFEGKVTDDGGTLTLEDSTAGITFPPGALPDGQGPVNVIIERVTGGDPCLPTNQPQYEACYHIRTEPDVDLDIEAVIGVCLEAAALPFVKEVELWKWDEVNESSLVPLPRRYVDFLDCDDDVSATTGVGRFFAALTRPIRSVLGPQPLYAGNIPVPFGGTLSDFSRVGWVRPLTLQVVAGAGQTAVAGTMVDRAPTVRVVSTISGGGAAGVPVTFLPGAGGSVSPVTVNTDANGSAATNWTLGGGTGPQPLNVQAQNPRPSWPGRPGVFATTSLSATAVSPPALRAEFLATLGPLTIGPAGWRSDQTPVLEICRLSGPSCIEPVATLTGFTVEAYKKAYRKDWYPPLYLTAGEHYRFRVLIGGVQVGAATALARPRTATGEVAETSFRIGQSLTIRFTIY
jgi:hypothetical protein